MEKKLTITELNKRIQKCKKCSLWRTRKNTVPGEGLINSKIMIIGQAPGVEEDKTGRPFVGRAGRFLNQLLEIAKIDRKNIFVTSPIKCFPPKNRKPTKKEINSCLPHLEKQIEIINPSKLILLGEVAFKIFFHEGKLKDFRGKRIKKGKREFFITYHPAAGLRFPKIRTCLQRDFVRLRQNLDSLR